MAIIQDILISMFLKGVWSDFLKIQVYHHFNVVNLKFYLKPSARLDVRCNFTYCRCLYDILLCKV